MDNVIVAMPNIEAAKKISEILKQRGIQTTAICTTASKILSQAHQLDSGIVICTTRFSDMYCTEIAQYLPDYFDMLLLSPKEEFEHCPLDVMKITMPCRSSDLLNTVEMMQMQLARRMKKNKSKGKKRSREEEEIIGNAKKILMERNHMSEPEAFRYIQKCSMDSGTNMVETAQMILSFEVTPNPSLKKKLPR